MILIIKAVCAKCGIPTTEKINTEKIEDSMIRVNCDSCGFFKFDIYKKELPPPYQIPYETAVIMNEYLDKDKQIDLTKYKEHKSTDTPSKEEAKHE